MEYPDLSKARDEDGQPKRDYVGPAEIVQFLEEGHGVQMGSMARVLIAQAYLAGMKAALSAAGVNTARLMFENAKKLVEIEIQNR